MAGSFLFRHIFSHLAPFLSVSCCKINPVSGLFVVFFREGPGSFRFPVRPHVIKLTEKFLHVLYSRLESLIIIYGKLVDRHDKNERDRTRPLSVRRHCSSFSSGVVACFGHREKGLE